MRQVFDPGIEEEAQEDLPRVARNHDEGHQRAARPADHQVSELSPVRLDLFAGQRPQAQIRLSCWPRPMQRDDIAEVVVTAGIASLPHHGEQPTGGQRRELGQGVSHERHEGVRHRSPGMMQDARQARLDEHPRHGGVMPPQLLGDSADRPFLDMVKAQDPSLQIRRYRHFRVPFGRFRRSIGPSDDAGTRGEPDPGNGTRTNDISWLPGVRRRPAHRRRFARSPPPPNPTKAHHSAAVAVNRDASLSFRRAR